MTRRVINCAFTVDKENITESETRRIWDRAKELIDEGYSIEEAKVRIKKELVKKNSQEQIKNKIEKIKNQMENVDNNYKEVSQYRDVAYFGAKVLSKEQAMERTVLDMIEGSATYKQSYSHQIEAGFNSSRERVDNALKKDLSEDDYFMLFGEGQRLDGRIGEFKQKLNDNALRELHNGIDGSTGDKNALKVAKILQKENDFWLKNILQGYDKEKLKKANPYAQRHNVEVLKSVGKDKWVNDIIGMGIDTEKTFNMKKVNEDDLKIELSDVYDKLINPDTKLPDGMNIDVKNLHGDFARNTDAYQIFFKNADSQISYNKQYNDNETIFSQFLNTFSQYSKADVKSKNFGTFEPSTMMNYLTKNISAKYGVNVNKAKIDDALKNVFGRKYSVNNISKLNRIQQNITAFGFLGKIVSSSITDNAGISSYKSVITGNREMFSTVFDTTANFFKIMSKDNRREMTNDLHQWGIAFETLTNDITQAFIDSGKGIDKAVDLTTRMANFGFRMSGVNAQQFASTHAIGTGILSSVYRNISIQDINPTMKKSLSRFGITENDVNFAKDFITERDGKFFLDREKLLNKEPNKIDLINKFQALTDDTVRGALNLKSEKTKRQMQTLGGVMRPDQPDNAFSFVAKSGLTLKSWGWEFMNNHIEFMLNGFDSKGDALKNLGGFALNSFALGYIQLCIKDMMANKTPRQIYDEEEGVNYSVLKDVLNYSGLLAVHGDLLMGTIEDIAPQGFMSAKYGTQSSISPVISQLSRTIKALWSAEQNAKEGDTDKMNIEIGKSIKHLFKLVPYNNNILLDFAMSYGAGTNIGNFLANKYEGNDYFKNTQEKFMKKEDQEYLTKKLFN